MSSRRLEFARCMEAPCNRMLLPWRWRDPLVSRKSPTSTTGNFSLFRNGVMREFVDEFLGIRGSIPVRKDCIPRRKFCNESEKYPGELPQAAAGGALFQGGAAGVAISES